MSDRQYVEGYVAGGDYFAIPLELVAYSAQARFMENPTLGFSVEDLIQRTVGLRWA